MRIAIAGGHGKIALILQKLLSDAGHEAVGLIRNPDHAADLLVAGGIPVVLDLEQVSAETLAADLAGVDAVVFAAGAGPDSGADRKLTVDRDAAVLLADAAVLAGIRRYVMISAMSADSFEQTPTTSSRSTCVRRARPIRPCASATSTGRSSGRVP